MNDCKHCNAQLFPDCECLTSSNNYFENDLSLPLSQYTTRTDFVSHVDMLMSKDLSLLHFNVRSLYKYYNLEVSKFMYKHTNSQLTVTFKSYSKFITDVHPYNTRQTKTRQFALPKARSNSGVTMIKYSVIEIWSRIPSEIINKTCSGLFSAEFKNMYYSATRNMLCVLIYWCAYAKWIDLIT